MKYIIVKHAGEAVKQNYFLFDPNVAVTLDFSCHESYTAKQLNIKQYYEYSEIKQAIKDCEELNNNNPVGYYAVCRVLEEPNFNIGFIKNIIIDEDNNCLELVYDEEKVFNSFNEFILSDYIVKNIKEFIREKNFYTIESENILLAIYNVVLSPTKLINTYSLEFNMSISNRKTGKIESSKFTFNKCYIKCQILEHIKTSKDIDYVIQKVNETFVIIFCNNKLTDLIQQ